MTLSYWREYRAYFHLAKNFDISESSCYRNIKWIEDILIKYHDFPQLAGKKALMNDYFKDKTIIFDATKNHNPTPKKDKDNLILVKRKSTPLKHK